MAAAALLWAWRQASALASIGGRLEDLGQEVGLRRVAHELEVAQTAGVFKYDRAEIFAFDQQEFDLVAS